VNLNSGIQHGTVTINPLMDVVGFAKNHVIPHLENPGGILIDLLEGDGACLTSPSQQPLQALSIDCLIN
jgi:hypothetical protein